MLRQYKTAIVEKAYFNMLKAVAPQNMEAERIAKHGIDIWLCRCIKASGEGYDAESALKSVASGRHVRR